MHEVREEVIDAQRPIWKNDLALMGWARMAPASLKERIVLPKGYTWADTESRDP